MSDIIYKRMSYSFEKNEYVWVDCSRDHPEACEFELKRILINNTNNKANFIKYRNNSNFGYWEIFLNGELESRHRTFEEVKIWCDNYK